MSVKRRLVTAGMPAAGVTVFAVLALTGQPASAASVDGSVLAAAQRVVLSAQTPASCAPHARGNCGYGDSGSDDRGGDGYGTPSPTSSHTPSHSPSPTPSSTGSSPTPTRSPTGGTDSVPPGGESPETVPPTTRSPVVSGTGETLPRTGAPVAAVTTLGALLAAAGAALMFGMRRRRSA